MKTAIFAAMAAACLSMPALAQESEPFTGPKVGAIVGYDTFQHNDGLTYGASAGFDLALTPKIRAGVDVALSDSSTASPTTNVSRDLSASLRLGYVLTPNLLGYAKLGYANTRFETSGIASSLEGVRYGAGLEYALTPKTYISAEYQRTEYEQNVGGRDAGLVGIGFRF